MAVSELRRTGVPLTALETVTGLLDRGGLDIEVFSKRPGPLEAEFRGYGIPVHTAPVLRQRLADGARFRGLRYPLGGDIRRARRVLRGGSWDAVVVESVACVDVVVGAVDAGLPVMWRIHELPPVLDLFLSLTGAEVLRSSRVVANSAATAAAIRERYGATDVDIVPPAVDVAWVRRRGEAEPSLALPRAPLVVGVGVVGRTKGADLFLDVVERLGDRLGGAIWLGEGPDLNRLRRRARNVDPSGGRIRFVGSVADPLPVVARADVVMIPSRSESLSRVALESLSLGVPVVGSDVGGLAEAVGPGGRLVPPDAEALAKALRSVLDDDDLRREMAVAGAAHVARGFDRKTADARFEAVLDEVTHARG